MQDHTEELEQIARELIALADPVQYGKINALLVRAYELGGFQADPRWRNVIATKTRTRVPAKRVSHFRNRSILEILHELTLQHLGVNPAWTATKYNYKKTLNFIASRVVLPPIGTPAKTYRRVEQKNLYRLPPESRTIRSSYIAAQAGDDFGGYRSLREALDVPEPKHVVRLTTNEISEEIRKFTNLRYLRIKANLRNLPDAISRLQKLFYFDLKDNQLEELPEYIGNLTWLTFLNLRNNQLHELPESIGNLFRLRSLDLRGNRLETLPESIGQLTNLTSLDLRNQALTRLPDGIGQLTKLTSLDLRNQALTRLPESIGQLTNLTSLNLAGNRLESLPASISNLSKLHILDLSGNRLTHLPELPSVHRLNLRNNPELRALPGKLRVYFLDVSGCTQLRSVPNDIVVRSQIELADSGLTGLPSTYQATLRSRWSRLLLWRGVPIDGRTAFSPETITAQEILAERNVELRRVMLERMGYEAFLRQANAEILDRDYDRGGERRLLRVPMERDEPLVCLSVIDPSTGRQYLLRVPPTMTTCLQAAAWIAGFDNPDDYHPLSET